ncbi:outer dynein arm docking complex protein like [Ectocarpus siliculosus]|uniref:Outer dynein arm docking complex protein like n=1 Tax=Ectocarpus siliculosus TaxID=2880 RepID=D7FK12_ECTSI|nr:outer dynein arm docking complex protein like [Ectocarpus siliculosus]|eukprot:CBJ49101.1 outer dynein arm docking complex protein like [Ectocarpus siliculosus]
MASALARSAGGVQPPQGDAQRVQDLQQLQREYRHMELNRRAYAEESQQLLRKQQANMEKLRRENNSLKTELAMEFRQFRKPVDSSSADRIAQLQEQADHFLALIETEKRAIDTVAEQTGMMKHKILHQRKMMGGVNAAMENEYMVQKQVRILENRLDKALTKFNEALAHNKTLRQEIDDLRRERVLFDTIYKKMERELSDRKKMMANVIELSNVNYEQRDNFQMEIAAVEQANRREQDDFENQMLELGRQMEAELHTGALGAPAPTTSAALGMGRGKGARAGTAGATATGLGGAGGTGFRAGAGAETGDSGKHHAGLLSETEESRSRTRGAKTSGAVLANKTDAQASLERIQNFEEAFARIRSATGIEDIEELVRTFVKNEDQNFSLFNYVNEQQNEVEKLEEQLHQLQEEEQKFTQESGSDVHQHKQALKDLEAKLVHTEAASEKYEVRCSEASLTIDALKDGVQNLFGRVFGGEALPETVSGGSVTDSNMMTFLGMIEEKTNSLLQAFARAKEREKVRANAAAALMASGSEHGGGEDDLGMGRTLAVGGGNGGGGAAVATVLGHGPQTPMRQELIHVNPPKLEDFSSSEESGSDDDDARPLTRDELKGRTLNKIQRKNAREGGGRGKGRGGRGK